MTTDAARTSHHHISSVINTLIADGSVTVADGKLRILEIGCGDGMLMAHLHQVAKLRFPHLDVEIHGFDIGDQGYHDRAQHGETVDFLTRAHPDVDWRSRVKAVADEDDWGFPPHSFDIAVSHVVFEHVENLDSFLSNLKRVVRPGGATIHFFPLANCIMEGHADVPFAHWIRDFDARAAHIERMNRLGVGRYSKDKQMFGHGSRREHAVETSKFIQCWTSYRTFKDIYDACYAEGLAVSYHYTKDFYRLHLRKLIGARLPERYRRSRFPAGEWLAFALLKYVSAVTLVIRPISYDIGERVRAEKASRKAPTSVIEELAAAE